MLATRGKPEKVNIDINNIDSFYRYKTIQLVVSDKANKTVFKNITKFSNNIKISETIIIHYLGYILNHKINESNSSKNDIIVYSLDGNCELKKINQCLKAMIEEIVLCHKCKLPETKLYRKQGNVISDCGACGSILNIEIKNDKFLTYIFKKLKLIKSEKKIIKNNEEIDDYDWSFPTDTESVRKRQEENLGFQILESRIKIINDRYQDSLNSIN